MQTVSMSLNIFSGRGRQSSTVRGMLLACKYAQELGYRRNSGIDSITKQTVLTARVRVRRTRMALPANDLELSSKRMWSRLIGLPKCFSGSSGGHLLKAPSSSAAASSRLGWSRPLRPWTAGAVTALPSGICVPESPFSGDVAKASAADPSGSLAGEYPSLLDWRMFGSSSALSSSSREGLAPARLARAVAYFSRHCRKDPSPSAASASLAAAGSARESTEHRRRLACSAPASRYSRELEAFVLSFSRRSSHMLVASGYRRSSRTMSRTSTTST
mmetsp:Transcript_109888/g.311657  ORF Transcript_109888/g.311657 Transcript_109888/m.311657 type:complete len:274 (-) Transcript_109888:248-1069(-)